MLISGALRVLQRTNPVSYLSILASSPRVSWMSVLTTAASAPEVQIRCCGRKAGRGANEVTTEIATRQSERALICTSISM